MRIADLALKFLLGHQGGHRVDNDHVDGIALNEHLGDVHGLFAAAGLADQERFELDAELFGPGRVEGVFGVDEGGDAPLALGAGHDVQGQRGLAARFGPEDFDHAAAGDALAAQGDVQREAAGGDAIDRGGCADAQRHDRPFAKLFLDLGEGIFQSGMGVEHGGAASLLTPSLAGCEVFLAMAGSIPCAEGQSGLGYMNVWTVYHRPFPAARGPVIVFGTIVFGTRRVRGSAHGVCGIRLHCPSL